MKKLLTKGWAKCIAAVLATVFFAATAVCGVCTVHMIEWGYYTSSLENLQAQWLGNGAEELGLLEKIYHARAAFPVSFAGGLLLTAACLAFLYAAAGRRGDSEEIRAGIMERIPFDVLTCLACLAAVSLTGLAIESQWAEEGVHLAVVAFTAMCGWLAGLFYTCSIAVRLKRRELLKGWLTVRVLRWCARWLKRAGRLLGILIRGVPLYGKAFVVFVGLSLVELVLISVCWYDMEVYVMFWALEKILLSLGLAYLILVLRKLQQGGKEIASGNMNYHVDTKYMFWDFEDFGECLNHIRDGLGRAVEDRMKSERFKTELITNVSHDIKTPLTSIISYVDLIKKEELPTETLREYVAVLDRQSQRLKKLIEDLVEASKASTGNLTVQLAECDVQVLLNQSMAEYQEKLEKAGLIPVLKQPDSPVHIRADGRHLWRIFDNLLNNICKYAMPGTRVYMDVALLDGEARITFRNISESPLQMDGETLLERFVRGDTSRHTEGSGLGLSIAASLAQLQHGRLELVTDGDLFKAELVFPAVLSAGTGTAENL